MRDLSAEIDRIADEIVDLRDDQARLADEMRLIQGMVERIDTPQQARDTLTYVNQVKSENTVIQARLDELRAHLEKHRADLLGRH